MDGAVSLATLARRSYHHPVITALYLTPLCPAGHLPLKGGDRPCCAGFANRQRCRKERGWRSCRSPPLRGRCPAGQRGAPWSAATSNGAPLMRPSLLDPLFSPITALEGIGPKVADMIAKVVPADATDRDVRVGDLLFVLPHTVIDRRNRPGIALAPKARSSRSTCASTATSRRRAATGACPTGSLRMTTPARSR